MDKATIYPVNHARYNYVVRFRRKGLKQYNRYFVNKDDAETDCKAFNDKLFEEGRQGLAIGPRERRALESFMLVCEERGLTITQATEIIRSSQKKRGHPAPDVLFSLKELREKQGRSTRTIKNLENQCLAFFDHCGRTNIEDIDREDVIDFVFAATAASSKLSRFAACTNLLNHGVKIGVLDKSPAEGIEPPKKSRKRAAIVFTPEDVETFLDELVKFKGGALVSYFSILIFAGLRPSEAFALTRKEIRAKTIRVDGGKMEGRSLRNVPIQPNLKAWLEAYKHLPLMPDSLNEHSTILKQARALSPVPWVQDICRHSFCSYRLAIMENEHKVAREAGNSPDTIYNHYHEAVDPEDAITFWDIAPED